MGVIMAREGAEPSPVAKIVEFGVSSASATPRHVVGLYEVSLGVKVALPAYGTAGHDLSALPEPLLGLLLPLLALTDSLEPCPPQVHLAPGEGVRFKREVPRFRGCYAPTPSRLAPWTRPLWGSMPRLFVIGKSGSQ